MYAVRSRADRASGAPGGWAVDQEGESYATLKFALKTLMFPRSPSKSLVVSV